MALHLAPIGIERIRARECAIDRPFGVTERGQHAVPIDLRVARIGSRSIAFTLDLLIELLAADLAQAEEPPVIQPGQSFPLWSPDRAYDAAAVLLRALDEETERA